MYKYCIYFYDYYDEDQIDYLECNCDGYTIEHNKYFDEIRTVNPEYKEDQIIESNNYKIVELKN